MHSLRADELHAALVFNLASQGDDYDVAASYLTDASLYCMPSLQGFHSPAIIHCTIYRVLSSPAVDKT